MTEAPRIRPARPDERPAVYQIRHRVYAEELGQHAPNQEQALQDPLDDVNRYLVAHVDDGLAGFVSLTPPNPLGYGLDKYLPRHQFPFTCDEGTFEVRLLTVVPGHRHRQVAQGLMAAALEDAARRGATRIICMGRLDLLPFYAWAGLEATGVRIRSGQVTFEVMHASVERLQRRLAVHQQDAAPHGGTSFAATATVAFVPHGEAISADVLDAWFAPSPQVESALARSMSWLLRTSPPTDLGPLQRSIAAARALPPDCVLPAPGSTDLIHRLLGDALGPASRVLLLDPTYSEYPHIVRSKGAPASTMEARDGPPDPDALARAAQEGFDWIVLVNPNNPTGYRIPCAHLEAAIRSAPGTTNWWIDETYIDFADPDATLEELAARSENVVVCKSMSKAYALSGARVAYAVGHPARVARASRATPPWSVSLIAHAAAHAALADGGYYRSMWQQTRLLANRLASGLRRVGWDVQGEANFLLCRLGTDQPDASWWQSECRTRGLFLRTTEGMGSTLGRRYLRVAVKDEATNRRMLRIIDEVHRLVPKAQAEAGAPA